MTDEEKKAIESFKRYINFLNNTLDDYYKMDDEFYKDQIEQLELSLKLCNKILNLTQNQQKEIEELKYLENKTYQDYAILKQKIKDKIEEYKHKNFIKEQVVMKRDKEALEIVDILQVLLEEK